MILQQVATQPDVIDILVKITAALAAAGLGAWITRMMMRGRLKAMLSISELSSYLFSKVDHIQMPPDIVDLRDNFRWQIVDPEVHSIPNGAALVPIGAAQQMATYLRLFLPKCKDAIEAAENIKKSIDSQQSTSDDKKAALRDGIHNNILRLTIKGKARRGTLSFLQQTDNYKYDASSPMFPWVYDDAGGEGRGTLGSYSINYGHFRDTFVFKFADEEERFKRISFAFAILDTGAISSILADTMSELKEDRNNASDMLRWLESNLDVNATLYFDVAVVNLGQMPILISGDATLSIKLPNQAPIEIKLRSESYSDKSEADDATARAVRAISWISKELEEPLPIRTYVPSANTLLTKDGQATLTFRSINNLTSIPRGDNILSLFRSGDIYASITLEYYDQRGKVRLHSTPQFLFRSSVAR
ncbi:MAG: hypothetical protein M1378_02570 [Bacteroidetes bacterium]|nr:hypothetical protein [Bacteroidota bacterium]